MTYAICFVCLFVALPLAVKIIIDILPELFWLALGVITLCLISMVVLLAVRIGAAWAPLIEPSTYNTLALVAMMSVSLWLIKKLVKSSR